jgi:hypothetical protein
MFKGLKKLIFVIAFATLALVIREPARAQCAQCAANVATNKANGGQAADGLNHGIVYLLAAPYLAVGILGAVWYKKYRRKNVDIHMRDEKLHLN